jgi:membrane protease YdiL (CAAX protease family)
VGAGLAGAAGGLLMWLVWALAVTPAITLSPLLGLGWMALVLAVFVRVYVLPARWNRRWRARSRVRSPGRAWPWILATAPAMALLPQAFGTMLLALGMARPAPLEAPLQKWLEQPAGVLAFAVLAVVMAPLVEEVGFRGWVQRPLERKLGAQAAIAGSALLFALAHSNDLDFLPVRLAGGLVLGHAVYATRSIWTGVALHVAWNAAALAFSAVLPDYDPTGKGWTWAGPAAGVALVSLVWCAWGVRRMQDAAAAGTGARGAARGRPVEQS